MNIAVESAVAFSRCCVGLIVTMGRLSAQGAEKGIQNACIQRLIAAVVPVFREPAEAEGFRGGAVCSA